MMGVICVTGRASDTWGGAEEDQRKRGSSFTSLSNLRTELPAPSQVRGDCCGHLPSGFGLPAGLPVALHRPPAKTVFKA